MVIIFFELFLLRLALFTRRDNNEKDKRIPFENTDCVHDFILSLPYELTNAQKRVIAEITEDLKKDTLQILM